MKHLKIELGLACKNSKDFINMLAVYLVHHLGINAKDIESIYKYDTHIATLNIHIHYIREGKLRGLFPDVHVNGYIEIVLDNGWDWLSIDLDNLSEKDVLDHLLCMKAFIEQIKDAQPNMFGEFDPSKRYD